MSSSIASVASRLHAAAASTTASPLRASVLDDVTRLAASCAEGIAAACYPRGPPALPSGAVQCRVIAATRHIEVALFELGPGGRLPPHNHPGMYVLTLVLRGSLREQAWSRDPASGDAACLRNALRRAGEAFITPPALGDGNIHALVGVGGESDEPALVIDWITPPYTPYERECTYYVWAPAHRGDSSSDAAGPAVGATGLLQELPGEPRGFNCENLPFEGRPVVL